MRRARAACRRRRRCFVGRGESHDQHGDRRVRSRDRLAGRAHRSHQVHRLRRVAPRGHAGRCRASGGAGPDPAGRIRGLSPEGNRLARHWDRDDGRADARSGECGDDIAAVAMGAVGHHHRGDAVGGPGILFARMDRFSPPFGRHEYADRDRNRCGISLFARGHRCAHGLHESWRGAELVLRGGDHHHRAHFVVGNALEARAKGENGGRDSPAGRPSAAHRACVAQPHGGRHPGRGCRERRYRYRPPRGADSSRRRRGEGIERGGRVDAHRRTDAGREECGRSGDRRNGQQHRRISVPCDRRSARAACFRES